MWVWVALAGAAGALARFALQSVIQSRVAGLLPWGTIVVNVIGSLALGIVAGLVIHQGVDPDVRTVVGTGFLGSFTTFSAYAYETFGLLEDGAPRAALVNSVGSVAAGLAAAAVGLAFTSL